jgi:hypothetical protein
MPESGVFERFLQVAEEVQTIPDANPVAPV